MIKSSLFFDTDCLSAFLWVKEESLLPKLYPGKIVIPQKVYDELSNPKVRHLKERIDKLVDANLVSIQAILIGTDEYKMYIELINNPQKGFKIIGEGEAASLVMAKFNSGVVASNNLKDIMQYIEKMNINYITTGDILMEAVNMGFINKKEVDSIWSSMLSKQRKLGANSFEEYIKNKRL